MKNKYLTSTPDCNDFFSFVIIVRRWRAGRFGYLYCYGNQNFQQKIDKIEQHLVDTRRDFEQHVSIRKNDGSAYLLILSNNSGQYHHHRNIHR